MGRNDVIMMSITSYVLTIQTR